MVAIPKRDLHVDKRFEKEHPLLVQIGFCAAILFVSVLLMTYGLDLSPGFFKATGALSGNRGHSTSQRRRGPPGYGAFRFENPLF